MRNLLEQIGLYGWQARESTVLCALLTDYPLLFFGPHGQAKTRGAETIARSFLGPDIVFQPHDYSRMSKEELVGVLDPRGLQQGQLNWIPTPTSVWGADAMLFDEFSYGNIMMGSMVHELLTHKTMMGQKTKVKLAMAACNPPDAYQANYLNLATCSRFVLVQVPSYQDLNEVNSDTVLRGDDRAFSQPPPVIRELAAAAATHQASGRDHEFAKTVVSVARKVLGRYAPIQYSTRQEKMLYRLALALRALEGADYSVNPIPDTLGLVESTVPELSGLVAIEAGFQGLAVSGALKQALLETLRGNNLLALVSQAKVTDPHGWAYEVLDHAVHATSEELQKAIKRLVSRKDISADIFNVLTCQLLQLYLPACPLPEDIKSLKVSAKNLKHVIQQLAS